VEPFGWVLVIEEPWQALLGPLLTYTELGPLLLVPLVVLATGIAWFAIRQLVTPLRELEARSAAMTRGDFEAVKTDVGGIAEISRLQQSLIFLAEKVESAQQSLRSYVGAITKGQEEERMRLAHELHDDTIQSLIALNQKVQMAQMSSEKDSSQEALSEINQMVEQSIEGVRRLTRDLRPLYLEDLGLAAALEMLAQETNKAGKLKVEYGQSGRAQRLDPEIELALYRITQEALNNSIQHAGASQVQVQLAFTPGDVNLVVSDDGSGFDVPESLAEFAHQGHFGLLGMYERAELIGARCDVRSDAGAGTRVELRVPASNGN
jgi:signal transduction histidine kinase